MDFGPLRQLLAAVLNACTAAWRYLSFVNEVAPYGRSFAITFTNGPTDVDRILDAAFEPEPAEMSVAHLPSEASALAWPCLPKVSLSKVSDLTFLIRPYIGPLAGEPADAWRGHPIKAFVGRAKVTTVALDELGLPKAPMADRWAPGAGIFEQALEAFQVRTGISNVSWA